jgi:(p)ppGpp synthase/HD superfamily hydrolase
LSYDPNIVMYEKYMEYYYLMNIYLNHFPKHEKYALCTQIRNKSLEVYSLMVEVAKRYHKKTTLTNLDIAHQQLRMLINLAQRMGYFRFKNGKDEDDFKYEQHKILAITNLVNELGRMIGAWIKRVNIIEGQST